MNSASNQKANEVILNSVGSNGSKEITGTSAVTPPAGFYFYCIDFLADATVTAQIDVTDAVNADLTALATIPAKPVFVKLTSITLGGGEAIGYLAKL